MNNNDLSGQCGNNKNSPGSCRGYASLFQRILRKSIQYLCNCRKSKEAITKGREQIANVLGAKPEEIYFTAGGSESDNWALKATFEAYKIKETTSSPQKSSIMRFFIPVSIWKKSAVRKSPISASMRTALSIWMNSKQPSHLRPF